MIDEWNERGISPEIATRISDAAGRISAQIAIVDLADLIKAYIGPQVMLDFGKDDVLIGIEILALPGTTRT